MCHSIGKGPLEAWVWLPPDFILCTFFLCWFCSLTRKYSNIYFLQTRTLSCITKFCLISKGSIRRLHLIVLFETETVLEPFLNFYNWQILNILGQLFHRMCLHLVLSDVFSCLDSGLEYLKTIDAFFLLPLKWNLCLICPNWWCLIPWSLA